MSLKQQIQTDVQTLKTLSLDILPASTYYGQILKYFVLIGVSLLGIQLIACKAINNLGFWQDDFERQAHHLSVVYAKMYLGCMVSSFVISVVMLSLIKWQVIFKQQLCQHLQTGYLLQRKIRQIAAVFYGTYGLFLLFWLSLFAPDMSLFAGLGALVFALPCCLLLIRLEFTRVGINVLWTGLQQYLNSQKS